MVVRHAIQRCIPVVNLTLVALAAYFQAFGITRMIETALASGSERPAAAVGTPSKGSSPVANASDHATSARAILDRNPFDSVTPRPLDAPPAGGIFACLDISCSERAPLCDGYKALVVLASPNPAWSMAAVRRTVTGVRLLGVRPESLLGSLGLENGDMLNSINGIAMTSPENGLEALTQLRTADHLGIRVNRRGKEVTIDFNVR